MPAGRLSSVASRVASVSSVTLYQSSESPSHRAASITAPLASGPEGCTQGIVRLVALADAGSGAGGRCGAGSTSGGASSRRRCCWGRSEGGCEGGHVRQQRDVLHELRAPTDLERVESSVPTADRVHLDVVAPGKGRHISDLFLGIATPRAAPHLETTGVVEIEVGVQVARRTIESKGGDQVGGQVDYVEIIEVARAERSDNGLPVLQVTVAAPNESLGS